MQRANPRDWRLDTIETVAKRVNINIRKNGGSHVVLVILILQLL